jgi:hypothetical protein
VAEGGWVWEVGRYACQDDGLDELGMKGRGKKEGREGREGEREGGREGVPQRWCSHPGQHNACWS